MPGKPIKLGPFVGGLNTSSDPTSINDAEVADIVNLELDIDGSLVSRPPIQTVADLSATWTDRIKLLGVAVFNGDPYLIGANASGIFYYLSGAWTAITTTQTASSMAQYAGNVYLLSPPNATHDVGVWSPSGGFNGANHPNFITMSGTDRGGSNVIIFKNRAFYIPGNSKSVNESRLIFSDPANASGFTQTTQFIDVNPGDGQKLIDACVYDDNLILFKEHSTYVLSYTSKPDDAELLNISKVIGATTANCVVQYENSIFVYHDGDIYEMVNYDFQKINIKVPFQYDSTAPSARSENVFLSIMGDRLIVRYYNRIYVYGLKTKTWSRWASKSDDLHNFGVLVGLPQDVPNRLNNEYYAGSCVSSNEKFYRIKDGYTLADTESASGTPFDIECTLTTKTYDMADAYQYKKMNWWGVDASTNRTVVANANPVTFLFKSTWAALSEYTWGDLMTWGNPLTTNASNSTVANPTGTTALRRFIKFPKALRFRQINYKLTFLTDGSTAQGPVKVFSAVVFGNQKATLPDQVN